MRLVKFVTSTRAGPLITRPQSVPRGALPTWPSPARPAVAERPLSPPWVLDRLCSTIHDDDRTPAVAAGRVGAGPFGGPSRPTAGIRRCLRPLPEFAAPLVAQPSARLDAPRTPLGLSDLPVPAGNSPRAATCAAGFRLPLLPARTSFDLMRAIEAPFEDGPGPAPRLLGLGAPPSLGRRDRARHHKFGTKHGRSCAAPLAAPENARAGRRAPTARSASAHPQKNRGSTSPMPPATAPQRTQGPSPWRVAESNVPVPPAAPRACKHTRTVPLHGGKRPPPPRLRPRRRSRLAPPPGRPGHPCIVSPRARPSKGQAAVRATVRWPARAALS